MRDRLSRHPSPAVAAITFPAVVAVVSAVLAVVAAHDPSFEALLDYRRSAVATGSLHRLVTAHFVHLSSAHAVLDIAGLALVAWIFAAELTTRRLIVVTCVSVASIDGGLWFLHPDIDRYAGLSGLLHGWFAAGAVGWALADRHAHAFVARCVWGCVLVAGLLMKLLLEQRGLPFWHDGDAMPVVTAAHRWGAAAGALCAAVHVVLKRRDARADGAS